MSFIDKIKARYSNNKKLQEEANNKLLSGGFGLAKTFWLYYFLISVIINIFYSFTEKKSQLLYLDAASLILGVTAFIAIKNTVTESKKWRIVALIIITLGVFFDAFSIIIDLFPTQFDAYVDSL